MLRTTVIAVVALALAVTVACVAFAATGLIDMSAGLIIWGALQLAIVLAGFVFERVRYKPLDTMLPGSGWEATSERFIDPETGAHVRVWFNPRTGERRYVAGSPV